MHVHNRLGTKLTAREQHVANGSSAMHAPLGTGVSKTKTRNSIFRILPTPTRNFMTCLVWGAMLGILREPCRRTSARWPCSLASHTLGKMWLARLVQLARLGERCVGGA